MGRVRARVYGIKPVVLVAGLLRSQRRERARDCDEETRIPPVDPSIIK